MRYSENFQGLFSCQTQGKDDLNRTLAAIREVKGVFSARRT